MKNIEAIATQIVDSSIKVHKALGPGLLESAYQECLAYELRKRGIYVQCEVLQPIYYDNQAIDAGYRLDMLVENQIIIENKCVDRLQPIHMAQILTYLKLRQIKLGFLINWNTLLIKNGIKRIANEL
jgi:GxxExxY protein